MRRSRSAGSAPQPPEQEHCPSVASTPGMHASGGQSAAVAATPRGAKGAPCSREHRSPRQLGATGRGCEVQACWTVHGAHQTLFDSLNGGLDRGCEAHGDCSSEQSTAGPKQPVEWMAVGGAAHAAHKAHRATQVLVRMLYFFKKLLHGTAVVAVASMSRRRPRYIRSSCRGSHAGRCAAAPSQTMSAHRCRRLADHLCRHGIFPPDVHKQQARAPRTSVSGRPSHSLILARVAAVIACST